MKTYSTGKYKVLEFQENAKLIKQDYMKMAWSK